MKTHALYAGALLAVAAAMPARAQTTPPLAYVQPLPPAAVGAVQERLVAAGVYTGRADGVWGRDSEAALQRFQRRHQLQVTGQLNQATAATLGLDPASFAAASQPAPAPAPVAAQPADQLSIASVRAIQGRLASLGFYKGAVDGMWGQSTQTAIQSFQQGRGLQPNGQLNPATVLAMGLTPDALAYR